MTRGTRVAVLAVDPSSTLSRGSILGDKTRMERLSRGRSLHPSPSGGPWGWPGKTRETLLLCEAAGYDVIPGGDPGGGPGGDHRALHGGARHFLPAGAHRGGGRPAGHQKGILELADAIWVNKADGPNRQRALATQGGVRPDPPLHPPSHGGWTTRAHLCSALTGEGIGHIWEVAQAFRLRRGGQPRA